MAGTLAWRVILNVMNVESKTVAPILQNKQRKKANQISTMKKIICIALLWGWQFASLSAQEIKKKNPQKSGNPIIEGWYADPEGVILNNQYWIFPTYSAKYKSQVFLDAFSSKDLTNWKKH